MAAIEFTDNYQDLSSDKGYQFKFHCNHCGNGHMSTWQANTLGVAGEVLRGASSIFGGFLGSVGSGAEALQRAVGGPAHDKALQQAVAEIKPLFKQCPRCGKWVCEKICWNKERVMCKGCAPILQEEIAHHQAEVAGDKVREKLYGETAEEATKGLDLKTAAVSACPACDAPVATGAKFCNACGKPVAPKTVCPACKAELAEGVRFCGSCGKPVGAKTNCAKCGAKLAEGTKFCGACGEKV